MRKFMIFLVSVVMVAVLLAMILSIGYFTDIIPISIGSRFINPVSIGGDYEVSEEHNYNLGAVEKIILTNPLGKVIVQGADTDQVTMKAVIKGRSNSQQVAQDIVRRIVVDAKDVDNAKVITVNIPKVSTPDYASVDLTLTVPRQIAADLSLSLGKLIVANIEGELNIKNNLGDVEINSFTGNADIRCDLGAITIRNSVFLDKLDIVASLGDVNVQGTLGRNTVIANRMGSVQLRIPRERAYSLDAAMSLGSFETSVPFFGERTQKTAVGLLGDGEEYGRLSINVNLGSINISH